jgi:quercetin dioxygenase-like cupin family protein
MTLTINGEVTTLGAMDSCTIPADEERLLENRSNHVAKMMVVMPYPGGKRP